MVWPRKLMALLVLLMGIAAWLDVPTSLASTGTASYIYVFSGFFVVGGILMMIPYVQAELAGLILPITGLVVWIFLLMILPSASFTGVLYACTLLVLFLCRAKSLYKNLESKNDRRRNP